MGNAVGRFRTQMLFALGLVPLTACGGKALESTGTGGDSTGSAAGGTPATGGSLSTGGESTGGTGGSSTGVGGAGGAVGVGGNGAAGATGGAGAGGASAGGAGGSAGTGVGGGVVFPCENEQPYQGVDSGYFRCDNGAIHRSEIRKCPSIEPAMVPPSENPDLDQCLSHEQCAEAPRGYCMSGSEGGSNYCIYGCEQDSDCGVGGLCVCTDTVGQCASAGCTSDAACSPGLLCTAISSCFAAGSEYLSSFECQTPQDECIFSSGCAAGEDCVVGPLGFRQCAFNCVVGRPFYVNGHQRVAPITLGENWRPAAAARSATSPDLSGLTANDRERLAQHYGETGQMEHASIAAFSRFMLQLLSLGAPARLVAAAADAVRDETRHAELCFAMASAFAGRPLDPGALDLGGVQATSSLHDAVREAWLEGCIGETQAALEAQLAAEAATDEAVRETLLATSADESRHAALAWQFVAWALEQDAMLLELVETLIDEVDQELASLPASATGKAEVPGGRLSSHGLLEASQRQAIAEKVRAEVVVPCGRTLITAQRSAALRPRAAGAESRRADPMG